MKPLLQLGALIAIALTASTGTWLFHGPATRPPPVCDPHTLPKDEICFALVPEHALWIDARSRAEWLADGYPGSILWNLDPAEDALKMEADAITRIASKQFVVVYCSSHACDTSRQIAAKIRQFDPLLQVKVLHGGHPAIPPATARNRPPT
jgi:rhodanese-related sulfurtransferase